MCGICGIISLNGMRPPLRREVEAMCDVIAHRGPDGAGVFLEGAAALGHRRLSIIDPASGQQPMSNEDENLQITFNGEIYNHTELRKGLEARGHHYRTHCDTETILHLFEEGAERSVNKLRGMFAFAIWDRQRQTLFCARDRLGVKPFYYTIHSGRFVFASEIKALLELPEIERRVNRNILPEFFCTGYVAGAETLFEGIYKLMPGHWLTLSDGTLTVQSYWSLRFPASPSIRPVEEYVEEFRELLAESVRLRLMSDVPLGAFLSGGLDSSAVVGLMRQLTGGQRIKTFSVGFAEDKYSELDYAREVAEHFETDHHEVRLDRETFFSLLPKMIWHEDEPVVWPSSVSLYSVAAEAAKHVKVVLTGEGSDELMGGYSRYLATIWNVRLGNLYWKLSPRPLQRGIRRLLESHAAPTAITKTLLHSSLYWSKSFEEIYFSNFMSSFFPTELPALLGADVTASPAQMNPYRTALEYAAQEKTPDLLSKLLYIDIRTYLVELLMKQDNMSMAASVESRVPFLDHRLVESVCAMPSSAKLRGLKTKYILRTAMEGSVPPSILTRRKRGFPTPLLPWMRQQHGAIRSILSDPRVGARQIVRPEAVRSLLRSHELGERNCTFKLWRLLNFELWCRIFFDRDGSESEIVTAAEVAA
ncbi:MAG: asparagine synthase (glutamine-hydrolyzing) [Candidatus Acidiferrales bacterium]